MIIITQIIIITINKTYFQIYKKIINITIHCGLALQKSVPPACNFTKIRTTLQLLSCDFCGNFQYTSL